MAKLLKVLRLYRLKKWIRDLQLTYNVHHGISKIVYIVIIILFATHLVACIWHGIGVRLDIEDSQECEGDIGEGWVCRENLRHQPDGNIYCAALYWSFSTLTTGEINSFYWTMTFFNNRHSESHTHSLSLWHRFQLVMVILLVEQSRNKFSVCS